MPKASGSFSRFIRVSFALCLLAASAAQARPGKAVPSLNSWRTWGVHLGALAVRRPKICSHFFSHNTERWTFDGTHAATVDRYEKTFQNLFGAAEISYNENYFDRETEIAAQHGGALDILDVMGSGLFLSGIAAARAHSITGVRLRPLILSRWEELKGLKLPEQIYGDILNNATWSLIDRSMGARGINKFNLIVMRPVGGWRSIPFWNSATERNGIEYIIDQAMQRLKPCGQFWFHLHLKYAMRMPFEETRQGREIKSAAKTRGYRALFTYTTRGNKPNMITHISGLIEGVGSCVP